MYNIYDREMNKMQSKKFKSLRILRVLILLLGVSALTLAIIITPTFSTNHLSPDHNISTRSLEKLFNYRLISGLVGILLIASGLGLMKVKNLESVQLLFGHVLNTSPLTWVYTGFLMSYLLFFVFPIFLSAQVMQFPKSVPAHDPIGWDLKQTLGFSESWFVAKQHTGDYTPITNVFFAPLLMVNFSWAYKIVTLVNLFCYVMITLVFSLRIGKQRQVSSLLMLLLISGLFSYGFLFELERGQFNVIAVFMCFFGIWIYHYHNKYRFLAYILFIISVQLKIYPFIFIVMLVNDWQDWRNNIKRVLILAGVNFALLFAFGPNVFVDFAKATIDNSVNPYVWIGNHSILSFMTLLSAVADQKGLAWVNQYSGLAQIVLLAIIAACISLIILQTYRQKQKGINPYLLLACTLGALLIPSTSHDYTLSILAAPVAILLSNDRYFIRSNIPRSHNIFIVLTFIFSAAYSSTLFSYNNKMFIFQNNFPALVFMLMVITIFSLMYKPILEGEISSTIETAKQPVAEFAASEEPASQ
jgi:hypothetical protein